MNLSSVKVNVEYCNSKHMNFINHFSGPLESYIDAVESEIEDILLKPIKNLDNLSKEKRTALQLLK